MFYSMLPILSVQNMSTILVYFKAIPFMLSQLLLYSFPSLQFIPKPYILFRRNCYFQAFLHCSLFESQTFYFAVMATLKLSFIVSKLFIGIGNQAEQIVALGRQAHSCLSQSCLNASVIDGAFIRGTVAAPLKNCRRYESLKSTFSKQKF